MSELNLGQCRCDFAATKEAVAIYDKFVTTLCDPTVNTRVAKEMLPALEVLMKNVVTCFAIATGQHIPYLHQVFSKGDIASIRYTISHHT